MTRKIDNLGRIVIPIEIRRSLNMDYGTPCKIRVNGDEVILCKSNRDEKPVVGVRLVGNEWHGGCPFCKNELMERFNKTCCGNCGNKVIWEKEQEEEI